MACRPAILFGVTLAAALCAPGNVRAQALKDVQAAQAPLVLKAQGSFFVGGEKIEQTQGELGNLGPGGHITVNQMYVRYMVPQNDSNLPVVMIHGATLTGKTWETTPDGRMGWDEYFVRKGHPVYVPDQVGRGRSGFNQAIYNNVRAGSVPPTNQPELLRFSDEGVWPNFRFGTKAGVPFPDTQFPIAAVNELSKQAVPDMNRGLPTPTPTIQALSDLAAQLEGAVLMGHSQSGSFPLAAALLNPGVTKALVLVEPGTCPANYTDEQIKALSTVPLLVVFGDHRTNPTGLPTLPTWQQRFDACQALIGRLKAAGGQAQMLDPIERGIRGNTHMIMQDKNSLQIADLILQWLGERAGKQSAGEAKPDALSGKQAGIVTIAAFTANGDLPELKIALNAGLDAGLTINEIKEILVQMYAYAGFPRSLNGINTFEEVLKERQQQGKQDPMGPAASPLPANKSSLQLGTDIRTQLTGSSAVAGYAKFVPVIDEFLRAHLFGDIFGRDNLDVQSREIATLSALATLEGLEAQLKGHFNVGLNVGLSEAQLRHIVATIASKVDQQQADKASQLLDTTLRGRTAQNTSPKPNAMSAPARSPTIRITRASEVPSESAPADYFTGAAQVQRLFAPTEPARASGGSVTFKQGARTNWHVHPLGQTLIVSAGTGWVQPWGGPVQEMRAGDIVQIPGGVKHWHGATDKTAMTHIAIQEQVDGTSVEWLERVSDAQYLSHK
jgi:quercetin dioxygenase-like cupin family protein/alkylhydroperoxidase/carboxymuconolactone decarboxylase family protein YurZ